MKRPQKRPARRTSLLRRLVLQPLERRTLLSSAVDLGSGLPGLDADDASFSGICYEDVEGDASQDPGDLGVGGLTVFLDEDDDGVLDAGEQTTVTAGDGSYTFTDLPAGLYHPTVVVPAGWGRSWPTEGQVYSFYLSEGQHADGKDFGLYEGATVSGTVWHDINGDVNQQVGEPGLENWTVYLDQDNDGELDAGEQTILTNADGYYEFTDLAPDVYYIRQVTESGWTLRYPGTGRHALQLVSGFVQTGQSFINYVPAVISGTKFEDTDADGVHDPGEAGLAGWTIYLDKDGDNTFSAGDTSVVTNGDGEYTFEGLLPGSYTVREVMETGWYQTSPDGEGEYTVDLLSQETATDLDFGNRSYEPVAEHVGPDGQTVTVYDLAGALDITEDDVVVKFGKAGDVKKISIGNKHSDAMEGLGIVVSNATAVGTVRDGRKGGGDVALFASDAPVKTLQLKSAMVGFDANGETLGGIAFPADVDGDGDEDDALAVYVAGPIAKLSVDGGVEGDVLVGGVDAKGYAAKIVQFKRGGFHGDMNLNGSVAKVQFGGDFGSSINVDGRLINLDVRGDLAGDVSTSGSMGKVSVTGGDLTGSITSGEHLAVIQVKAAKEKGTKALVGGNITGAEIDVDGILVMVKGTGDLTNGHLSAGTLGLVQVRGEISATEEGCYIRSATIPFGVRDATDALVIDTVEGEWFDGLHAYIG